MRPPGALLSGMLADGVVDPIALMGGDRVLLAGPAEIVLGALRALGDNVMADRIEAYLRDARGLVLSLDSATNQVSVHGVPRGVSLTSAGGRS